MFKERGEIFTSFFLKFISEFEAMNFFKTQRQALFFFLCLAVGSEWFIDDPSRVANRQQVRYNSAQIQDMYFAYNHLLKPIY